MKAPFITIEGIDGTGKTTVANAVQNMLEGMGFEVFRTKEPGDSNIGPTVRELLFKNPGSARREDDPTHEPLTGGQVDCLMLACHLGHVEYRIKPALAAGKAVISDRYYDSQFAYAMGRQHSDAVCEAFGKDKGPTPDVTILLTGNVEECLSRAKGRDNDKNAAEPGKQKAKEWARVDLQKRIQDAYLHQIGPLPRTLIFDVTGKNQTEVVIELLPLLGEKLKAQDAMRQFMLSQKSLFGDDMVLAVGKA